MTYTPEKKILEKYADLMINFALGEGKGIKKGDVVLLNLPESAKDFLPYLRRAIYKSGGHLILQYIPEDEQRYDLSPDFYNLASKEQLDFFPEKYLRGLVDQVDHLLFILSESNKHILDNVDADKIMQRRKSFKPFMDWRRDKENKGKMTWSLAAYATESMAKEANLTLKDYWQQIITACFLDLGDPIARWRQVHKESQFYRQKLNQLGDCKLHIEGQNMDLWIGVGKDRLWQGGSGHNIPSFEIFTSPDWRQTNGYIRFNQPLYRYGKKISNIELKFKDGKVIDFNADQNLDILKAMIETKNADKIGEFSLTDRRHSQIDHFMAETLFDENMGGEQGNTHIALGAAYADCYAKDPTALNSNLKEKLGFNDSIVHTDIISTQRRKVTAYLSNNEKKVIYKDGEFKL